MLSDEHAELSETDVMKRLRDGDIEALATAYRRWGALVHTAALRSLRNHHDAEDVTQQVFVSAWRSRESLRPGAGSLPGWLVTITRRRCADLYEARAREQRGQDAVAEEVRTALGATGEDLADRIVVAQELELLGDPRARILRMAVVEGRSHSEIAALMEMPLGTVKSHVRRGLVHLRSRLEEADR